MFFKIWIVKYRHPDYALNLSVLYKIDFFIPDILKSKKLDIDWYSDINYCRVIVISPERSWNIHLLYHAMDKHKYMMLYDIIERIPFHPETLTNLYYEFEDSFNGTYNDYITNWIDRPYKKKLYNLLMIYKKLSE
jgi:hypothetical protein